MTDDIESRCLWIVKNKTEFEGADVNLASRFIDDLGADSLNKLELVMSFEDEFGIEIRDDEAEKITTVQRAVDFVRRQLLDEHLSEWEEIVK